VIFDPELVRRIESSAARVTMARAAGFTAQAAGDPARAAVFGAGALVAFGPGRYVNRAVGISLDELDDDQLDELEAFYDEAGVPASLEVASWAPVPLVQRLAMRGYTVSWFRNVYAFALDDHPAVAHPALVIDVVTDDLVEEWLAVIRAGNGMTSPEAAVISDEYARAAHSVAGATDFLAHLDSDPAGCGSLVCESGIGWLGGATTAPAYRRRGVQGALVRRRMAAAYEAGCDVAVVTAVPAGDSARNLARLGFTLAYCQAVLTKVVG
jgi:GNAT superfamily N-acetyltransferase